MIVSLHLCSSGNESLKTHERRHISSKSPSRVWCRKEGVAGPETTENIWPDDESRRLTVQAFFLHKDHRKMDLMTTPLSFLAASLLRDHCVCLNQRFFLLHSKLLGTSNVHYRDWLSKLLFIVFLSTSSSHHIGLISISSPWSVFKINKRAAPSNI